MQIISNNTSWKSVVRVSSVANLTLTAPQTVDDVVLIEGDTILVKNQTTASENGSYIVKDLDWVRSDTMLTGSDAAGAAVFIKEGTTNSDTIWICIDDKSIVGTDPLTFASIPTFKKELFLNPYGYCSY